MSPVPAMLIFFLAALAVTATSPRADPPHPMPASLPRVLAMPADPLRAPPGAEGLANGSGFFVSDHIVITAAHVVAGCRTIALTSPFLAPVAAKVVGSDGGNDIALLHSDGSAPAVLALGRDAPGRVRVLGFPGAARTRAAAMTVTSARLVNGSIAAETALERDPAVLLWLQAHDVGQGYSGGPVLDPESGLVVGLVRATLDPGLAARHYAIDTPDLVIGPGVVPLRAMFASGPQASGAAERAVVRVMCWQ